MIARLADQGKDVPRFFTNKGLMMEPVHRVNVDFTSTMLEELDQTAEELNVSRAGGDQNLDPASTRSTLPGKGSTFEGGSAVAQHL
jgi:hypothetical protein